MKFSWWQKVSIWWHEARRNHVVLRRTAVRMSEDNVLSVEAKEMCANCGRVWKCR